MANEEQLAILRQGVDVWNRWRKEHRNVLVDLTEVDFSHIDLQDANFRDAHLFKSDFTESNLARADFSSADLTYAKLCKANLSKTKFVETNLTLANLIGSSLVGASLTGANLRVAYLSETNFKEAQIGWTILGTVDLSEAIGLEDVIHLEPSVLGIDTLQLSKGKIPEAFLRGCGLSDWEIEQAKLYNPDLTNEEITNIQYRLHDLRASQALQISPLFISYSQKDSSFVDKVETQFNKKGIRFWRDIHDMKAGRMEKQIDRAIRQNPTVLLVLSEHSLSSDWVEHEVRAARGLEKDMGRDVLCPVALDDSWKSSHWPARIMEQIMEYNILDFSEWEDDVKFDSMFCKLIDGLELFYKG
jgi:uncharacterized protein YjbI with pentapeptide repeats